MLACSLIVALLASAPVLAAADRESPDVPTLCPPGGDPADPTSVPTSVPTADSLVEPVPDAAAPTDTTTTAPSPVETTTTEPTGSTQPSDPSGEPCLPPCEDEPIEPVDPAATVPPTTTIAPTTTVDPETTTTDVELEPDEITCIPASELEPDAGAEVPTGDPAATPAPTPATAPVEPVVPVEVELEAPLIPDVPAEGWPIRLIRFPVHGPIRYDDDWGNCRGGPSCPRRHLGNDIVGVRLQPLVAAADGVVTHLVRNHPTAGWGLVITDDEGWDYRYYHVNNDTPGTDDGGDDGTWRFIEGLTVGSEVIAGQVVGYMGDSGNSEQSVPHLHFEIHGPDGSAIDPFRSLHLAEWIARCGGASDPYRDVMVPVPFPETATQPVEIAFGDGEFLLGNDGSWAAIGDARRSGDARHMQGTPRCPPPL